MVSKHLAMQAEGAEIQYLSQRWRLLPGDQQGAGVLLDDLLRAQERLADSELDFARSQFAYNMSLVELKRVTGTLLEWQTIAPLQTCEDGLPTVKLQKANARPMPANAAPAPMGLDGPELVPAPDATTTRSTRRLPTVR
jgi:outer membrane protein